MNHEQEPTSETEVPKMLLSKSEKDQVETASAREAGEENETTSTDNATNATNKRGIAAAQEEPREEGVVNKKRKVSDTSGAVVVSADDSSLILPSKPNGETKDNSAECINSRETTNAAECINKDETTNAENGISDTEHAGETDNASNQNAVGRKITTRNLTASSTKNTDNNGSSVPKNNGRKDEHDTEAPDAESNKSRSVSQTWRRNSRDETEGQDGETSSVERKGKGQGQLEKDGDNDNDDFEEKDDLTSRTEIVSLYLTLKPLPSETDPLQPLTNSERRELETILEIGNRGKARRKNSDPSREGWKDDWIGNLAFADKDILNPDSKSRDKNVTGPKKPLLLWAEKGRNSLRALNNLLRFVFNLKETPPRAKAILANANPKSIVDIQESVRRVSYDPVVLCEDGWTTAKSAEAIGASGGPNRIGEKVYWQGFDGVVIAYIHDHDLGDLWKAMWLEEFDTFDLEAEELEEAKKRYDRRQKQKQINAKADNINKNSSDKQTSKSGSGNTSSLSENSFSATAKPTADGDNGGSSSSRRSNRYSAYADFRVKGIEHGIILATSYSRGARPGVFWPARVMHASEMHEYGSQNKRGSQRQKLDVVFLAPYWNVQPVAMGARREAYSDTLSKHGSNIFSSGPLFEMETIDASEECVQEYPYDAGRGIDLNELRLSFKFAGLPKAAFSRFMDSHRLALGLKTYSQTRMKSGSNDLDLTTAGLFEAHPLSVQTALFPPAVLHLPFGHILSQMPPIDFAGSLNLHDASQNGKEPALQLGLMVDSMKPPLCWGQGDSLGSQDLPIKREGPKAYSEPILHKSHGSEESNGALTIDPFVSDLKLLKELLSNMNKSATESAVRMYLDLLLGKLPKSKIALENLTTQERREQARSLVQSWTLVKNHGEELIATSQRNGSRSLLEEWRRVCERLYSHMTRALSTLGFGDGVSAVLTDSRCNQHLTESGCFERPVRLPAALKAAKEAGAGSNDSIQLLLGVDEHYVKLAENKVIMKAHTMTYLKRIKSKCMSVPPEKEVVALTEGSDGNGGEDTKGCRGTWQAAIIGVGAALKGVDMIMNGECVNAFCVTRPPGHHAGRELHPMKAVSNGFCILNSVACAALYATSPVSEGGVGLKRVCVIDIDVHHGNGTQDILCSTYDPRFLYVSVHAGGVHVNGIEPGEDADQLAHHLGRTPTKAIFPGRCGDKSPHEGVLNIPLGAKVTAHALGTALITKVTPAVEFFAPQLIIVSAGFDAHKNDPLGLGGLDAEDYATLTEVVCQLANKSCSGRVLSVLEGGYGVPCCRLQEGIHLPQKNAMNTEKQSSSSDTQPEVSSTGQGDVPLNEGTRVGSELTANTSANIVAGDGATAAAAKAEAVVQKPILLADLGDDLPGDMRDDVPYPLQRRLEKCHAEGFMECVSAHVRTLGKCNKRT